MQVVRQEAQDPHKMASTKLAQKPEQINDAM